MGWAYGHFSKSFVLGVVKRWVISAQNGKAEEETTGMRFEGVDEENVGAREGGEGPLDVLMGAFCASCVYVT